MFVAAASIPTSATGSIPGSAKADARKPGASDFLTLVSAGKPTGKTASTIGRTVPLNADGTLRATGAVAGPEAKGTAGKVVEVKASDAAPETSDKPGAPTADRVTEVKRPKSSDAKSPAKAEELETSLSADDTGEAGEQHSTKSDSTKPAAATMPPALAFALAAGAASRTSLTTANAGASPTDTIAETPESEPPVAAKAKLARPATRRDNADAGLKPDGPVSRSAEGAPDTARTLKAETQTATAPTPAKPAEPAATTLVTPAASLDPQGQPMRLDTQTLEARIPLGAREAAHASAAAPVLMMRVNTGNGVTKSIEIRLDPAELGRVDVKLETGLDGKLRAVLSADNAAAFELLKKDSSTLEAALRGAGIDLDEGAISFTLNDSAADQSARRETAYGGAESRRAAAVEEELAAPAARTHAWRDGVIDIQA